MTDAVPNWPKDEWHNSPEVAALLSWLEADVVVDGEPMERLASEYDLYCREHGLHDYREGPLLTRLERKTLLDAFENERQLPRARRWKPVLDILRRGDSSPRFHEVVADLIGLGAFSARGLGASSEDALLALKSELVWRVLRRAFPGVSDTKINNLAFTLFARMEGATGNSYVETREALKQRVSNGIDKRKALRVLVERVRLDPWAN